MCQTAVWAEALLAHVQGVNCPPDMLGLVGVGQVLTLKQETPHLRSGFLPRHPGHAVQGHWILFVAAAFHMSAWQEAVNGIRAARG